MRLYVVTIMIAPGVAFTSAAALRRMVMDIVLVPVCVGLTTIHKGLATEGLAIGN
jgi:hypothetical protein